MRFFAAKDDPRPENVYVVCGSVKNPSSPTVNIVMARRGLTALFGDGKSSIEVESSRWVEFRRVICKGCDRYGAVEWGLLCAEGLCEREVVPF